MSDHSPVAQAFVAWAYAETAAHYAADCPDEVMNDLTGTISKRLEAMFDQPSENAGDVLLKAFSIMLYRFEPKVGDAPLTPKVEQGDNRFAVSGIKRLIEEMRFFSDPIAAALAVANRDDERAKAKAAA